MTDNLTGISNADLARRVREMALKDVECNSCHSKNLYVGATFSTRIHLDGTVDAAYDGVLNRTWECVDCGSGCTIDIHADLDVAEATLALARHRAVTVDEATDISWED